MDCEDLMKLQPGLLYRTRDGRTAGPIERTTVSDPHPWTGSVEGERTAGVWTDEGQFFSSGSFHNLDLVGRIHRSRDKAIDQITLEDYRRGVAKLRALL
ncbi:hypothetical protein [Methylobacterium oxalidis]|uniref:Uncharacterized protein n=1 Tax=Methylobacterium oxalidis TaxID=944322 RepID=A0A512J4N4_9HYPH|nr:hypothetical protein [Methylobacterium oxalidis]GEP04809.1 hypothetical protein MOX02_28470 [Methylobacterium oxalidis]GJE30509.1 hypothetical protein LDDCCGHA_0677 [Methylobacterium oxalidis]GLS63635.1 hypothetical protein GCM10007888_20160 [Methylobacterium oxalidis]